MAVKAVLASVCRGVREPLEPVRSHPWLDRLILLFRYCHVDRNRVTTQATILLDHCPGIVLDEVVIVDITARQALEGNIL